MAAPNLRSPNSIVGKTLAVQLGTSLASILANAGSSGTCVRINSIRVTNITGSAVTVRLAHYRSSTSRYIAYDASVDAANALVVLQRDEFVYLEEGDSLYASCNTASAADCVASYDVWS